MAGGSRRCKRHTDLKPHLFVQGGDLLGGTEERDLLTLRLQGHMAINLRMDGEMGMAWGYRPGGRRLGVRHDPGASLGVNDASGTCDTMMQYRASR